MTDTPIPQDIRLEQKKRTVTIIFDNGETFVLPCELLRVYSPSAEVQGHGAEEPKLEVSKEQVNINAILPVGNYAVQIHFDDGHHTGIYHWALLYDLGKNQEAHWQAYLDRLAQAGYKRVIS